MHIMEGMKNGDVFEVIKDWDIDKKPAEIHGRTNAFRRSKYYVGNRIKVGDIGEETQLGYWRYPEYFKKLDKHEL